MNNRHLPFWSFFHDIEKTLSYERWIDKYTLFFEALSQETILYDKDWHNFKQFCKALYLQDYRDEEKFEKLLDRAIEKEQNWLLTQLRQTPDTNLSNTDADGQLQRSRDRAEIENSIPEKDPVRDDTVEDKTNSLVGPEAIAHRSMFYLPPMDRFTENSSSNRSLQPVNFLLTDEYFPVTRRQMVKAWQFLRHKERGIKSDGLDLEATVIQIAKNGLFLEPIYKPSLRNREDTLIIFSDYRGSMTPFHELSNRLIHTAKTEGGHPRAPLFYFQNYPVGYVYKNPNLTQPLKLKEALLKTNRNFTLAIIISDAGAARGNTDPGAIRARVDMTSLFLDNLNESCAHTIWLNPMPRHRWKNTAAELIEKKVFLMTPVLEHNSYNFQEILRTILKQNLKKIKANR
jgi:uncharacterized protein with von Willebrand factor type A (vWA) domain